MPQTEDDACIILNLRHNSLAVSYTKCENHNKHPSTRCKYVFRSGHIYSVAAVLKINAKKLEKFKHRAKDDLYCGETETETIGHFFINCTGNGVDRNIKDACGKLQLDTSSKSVLNCVLRGRTLYKVTATINLNQEK